MPNHITNIIRVSELGETTLSEVHSKLLNSERQVDFSVITPKPECLNGFEPHSGIVDAAKRALGLLVLDKRDGLTSVISELALSNAVTASCTPLKHEDIPGLIRAIQNYQDCGHIYWYDWCNENWGTKWGAYDQPEKGWPNDAIEFRFQTAWSHPALLMEKLSKSLPDVTFEILYADEDTGSNCGRYTIKAGKSIQESIAPSWGDMSTSEKATWTEFAFRINHPDSDPAEYGYGPDWVYSEEIYEEYEAKHSA